MHAHDQQSVSPVARRVLRSQTASADNLMHRIASTGANAIQAFSEADQAVALTSHMNCVSTNGTAFIVAVYKMQQKEKVFSFQRCCFANACVTFMTYAKTYLCDDICGAANLAQARAPSRHARIWQAEVTDHFFSCIQEG